MMIQTDTFILSKQGWLPIAFAATIFLFFTVTGLHLFQFISGAILIALLVIFRNPERNSAIIEPNSVLSCADGIVLAIEDTVVDDKTMKKVTVRNSLWDVSMLRAPFDGVIEGFKIRHGVSLPLYNPLSESLNEKAVLSFRSLNGDEIFIEHTSEQSCFSIAVDAESDQKLREGSRYGFLAKGRTIMYLPADVTTSIYPGSEVRAGVSVIAQFNHA